ncbi:MAG: hypothetical protein R6V04_01195 [bacterium]
MKFYTNDFKKIILFFIAIFLFLFRVLWEYMSPVGPDDFKGLMYFRDIVTIFPASFLICFIFLKRDKFISSEKLKFLDWIQQRWRLITLIMSLVIFCLCSLMSMFVFKTCAHIVDEANYLFQAKVFAAGRLTAPPAALSEEFFQILYFIQSPDKWYSSFFPGQSVLLAVGILMKVPFLINPFLTAVLLLITVWAGKKLYSINTGVMAGFFLLCSPFVLFQGASFFSHIFPAVLITIVLVWVLNTEEFFYGKVFVCGLMTGIIFLFRPVSAVVVILFLLSYFMLQRIKPEMINKKFSYTFLIVYILGILPGILLLLGYNNYLTGHYFITPHQLALPNETLGFGVHSIKNTVVNITGLSVDLLALPLLSLIPVILFFLSDCKYSKLLLIFSIMYILAYSIYPYHGLSYGPRFYFEIVPILLIGSSRVLLKKCSFFSKKLTTYYSSFSKKAVIVTIIITVPIVCFFGIMPGRISVFSKRGEYYHIRNTVQESVTPPAVVSIKSSEKYRLIPYLAGFQLNSPAWDGNIIFVRYLPEKKGKLMITYPKRKHYILDMDEKIVFSGS